MQYDHKDRAPDIVAPSETVTLNSDLLAQQGLRQPEGTILIVDDDENLRLVTSAMLGDLGFSVLSALNGFEALDLYRRHQDEIIVVLMDMSMPEMDGKECCSELHNINPVVKVILASGYNEQDAVGQGIDRRLAGFIQKPYSLAALEAVLETALKE